MTTTAGARSAAVHHEPFTWAVVTGFLDDELAHRLAAEFPTEGFRVAGTSAKLFSVRSLVVAGTVHSSTATLSPAWRDLASWLASPEHRRAFGDLVGLDLTGLRIDASLCRYPPGCSLAPHTDRPVRRATHVLYLNPLWRPEWGGEFRVLRSDDVDDVIERVLPTLGTSVAMVRSDRSWHAVGEVAAGVAVERRSVLVHASWPE
ncbi:2OG-Fe(II) oxygenase [Cellulomonas alba]|uniref:2OG-Fe(II) oxygenase n=1 Tax=Cellulomonas alba TaxID=3053467 RepID=A0ABT7SCG8_9CELL|nr:2OG-Fe(II) oxygenase [Cellulomonas alba]MDM7853884.1 2OG-Fe(II) oxygenase [Cellulomonas alba]